MFLDYFALGVLVFVVATLFYAVIAIHDIPHLIAMARNHPQDAIGVATWVSLFTLHAIWPLLFIWAAIYRRLHRTLAPRRNSPEGAFAHEQLYELRIPRTLK
ncbi:DUF3302 domain-containing protein [Rhizobium mongolense]|uniref:DUF3302 domain-containing protein n=1 Tax=Rhizobium mongolense TaxID=57676 RepID=UPI000B89F58F|nr:DUF3302 domain-containing protein [Rhizobium mongolense]